MLTLESSMLSVHILRVGDGDAVVIELPKDADGSRHHIVVDSYNGPKTVDYLKRLEAKDLKLVVATHPHLDHIAGLRQVLEAFPNGVEQFWDSGFRHNSGTWNDLIQYVESQPDVLFLRPTSGLTTTMSGVEVTVLAPSINLRNRYDTYGVNINNASIVLKLTYGEPKASSIILAGDAQWESWAKMTEEFPHFEKTENPDQKMTVKKEFLPLKCQALKVAHHGSKHGTALEAIEKLRPTYAAISVGAPSKYEFPDPLATEALTDLETHVLKTGGPESGGPRGTVVFTVTADGTVGCEQLGEAVDAVPPKPTRA